MSDWVKKVEAEAKGLLAEAEEELTVLEGVDTIDPLADDDPAPEDGTKADVRLTLRHVGAPRHRSVSQNGGGSSPKSMGSR